jgi:hypothetical protein
VLSAWGRGFRILILRLVSDRGPIWHLAFHGDLTVACPVRQYINSIASCAERFYTDPCSEDRLGEFCGGWTGGICTPCRPLYHTRNWPMYNRALEGRESTLSLFGPDMEWLAESVGKVGGPAVFSDAAIHLCLSVKNFTKLPPSRAVGVVRAVLMPAGPSWPVPGCATLCRCQNSLTTQVPY